MKGSGCFGLGVLFGLISACYYLLADKRMGLVVCGYHYYFGIFGTGDSDQVEQGFKITLCIGSGLSF